MAEQDKSTTPPWGDDFDAERAWTLVQNLRAEREALQEKVATVTAERDEARQERDAAKDGADPDAAAKLAAAEERAREAERGLALERVLNKFPTLREHAEFLTGDTEDEIEERAKRLAALGGPAASAEDSDESKKADDDEEPEGSDPAPVDRTPRPDLRPGHGGEPPATVDTDAIVAKVRATY